MESASTPIQLITALQIIKSVKVTMCVCVCVCVRESTIACVCGPLFQLLLFFTQASMPKSRRLFHYVCNAPGLYSVLFVLHKI